LRGGLNITLVFSKLQRCITVLIISGIFHFSLFSTENTQVSILFTSETEGSVNFIIEITGIKSDGYHSLTEQIDGNRHVRVSDMQSFPQKGKLLLTIHLPDNRNLDAVVYNGSKILVSELSDRYALPPKSSEFKQIKKP
jgi:hypothetical protein